MDQGVVKCIRIGSNEEYPQFSKALREMFCTMGSAKKGREMFKTMILWSQVEIPPPVTDIEDDDRTGWQLRILPPAGRNDEETRSYTCKFNHILHVKIHYLHQGSHVCVNRAGQRFFGKKTNDTTLFHEFMHLKHVVEKCHDELAQRPANNPIDYPNKEEEDVIEEENELRRELSLPLRASHLGVRLLPGFPPDAVNKKGGEKALNAASRCGADLDVRRLLSLKANPEERDSNSRTALHIASQYGRTVVVNILLQAKANPSLQRDDGGTALHFSINAKCTELLLQAKAQINVVDKIGMTALHRAASRGNLEVVQTLVSARAQVDLLVIELAQSSLAQITSPTLDLVRVPSPGNHKEIISFLKSL